jgi:hypothetical protein
LGWVGGFGADRLIAVVPAVSFFLFLFSAMGMAGAGQGVCVCMFKFNYYFFWPVFKSCYYWDKKKLNFIYLRLYLLKSY